MSPGSSRLVRHKHTFLNWVSLKRSVNLLRVDIVQTTRCSIDTQSDQPAEDQVTPNPTTDTMGQSGIEGFIARFLESNYVGIGFVLPERPRGLYQYKRCQHRPLHQVGRWTCQHLGEPRALWCSSRSLNPSIDKQSASSQSAPYDLNFRQLIIFLRLLSVGSGRSLYASSSIAFTSQVPTPWLLRRQLERESPRRLKKIAFELTH